MGSILGDFGRDCGFRAIGTLDDCGVLGDGVGFSSSRKFSSWIDDEMMSGDSSEDDEFRLILILILEVLLMGRDVDDKLLDLDMEKQGYW